MLRELEQPNIWNQPERALELGKQRAQLEMVVNGISSLEQGLSDAQELLEMAAEENDDG